jgi:cytochrome c oxidase subunit 2
MIQWFLPQASSFAGDVDFLFLLITLVVGFWFILTELVFFGLMVVYQKREGKKAEYITGDGHEKHWIHVPHWIVIVCDVFLIVGAIMVWNKIKIDMPEKIDATIKVIGQQWAWTFVHPGPDGDINTEEDNIITIDELHVQKGLTYKFDLSSKDVLHNFSVPVFRLKQDAVPGRTISGWFKPTKTGTFDIQCAEMCGTAHGIMNAFLHIEDAENHENWMKQYQALAHK